MSDSTGNIDCLDPEHPAMFLVDRSFLHLCDCDLSSTCFGQWGRALFVADSSVSGLAAGQQLIGFNIGEKLLTMLSLQCCPSTTARGSNHGQ